ncbi:MAG: ABC transporter permease, partial [Candidatus Altiarchaeota archaeon]|nr:ABC transporter permease [Candidatus Altiarchaeota archaeon]
MSETKLLSRRDIKTFDFLSDRYLNLIKELTLSRFKLSEQSTFLGFLWTLLYPILSVLIFYMLFSSNIGSHVEHFGIYLFIGVISWNLFSNTTSRGLGSLMMTREILKNSSIPYEVVVVSEVLVRFISFIFEIFALFALLLLTGVGVQEMILLLPFIILLEFMLAVSISFILSCLNLFFSDIGYIWSLTLNIMFFTTPVFYDPIYLIPESVSWLYHLNPMANIMYAFRDVTLYGRLPNMEMLGYTFLFCTISFFASL